MLLEREVAKKRLQTIEPKKNRMMAVDWKYAPLTRFHNKKMSKDFRAATIITLFLINNSALISTFINEINTSADFKLPKVISLILF